MWEATGAENQGREGPGGFEAQSWRRRRLTGVRRVVVWQPRAGDAGRRCGQGGGGRPCHCVPSKDCPGLASEAHTERSGLTQLTL